MQAFCWEANGSVRDVSAMGETRGWMGRRVLFMNSINPRRMPFVDQQINILGKKGLDVRVLARVADREAEAHPLMLYEGFLSEMPPLPSRIWATLSAEVAGLGDPHCRAFLREVTQQAVIGRIAAAKRLWHWRRILSLLQDWRPELIHAHFAWHLPFAIPLAEYLDIPIICTAHHSDIYFEDDWAENLMHPRVRHVISIAESVHGYMMDRCPQLERKTTLIYNPINPDFLRPLPDRTPGQRILNVASFKSIKNQAWLIRALARLKAAGQPFHCDLVGVGERFEAMRQLASELGVADQVSFLGYRAHAEVLKLMDEADVFALTSESEGLPTVVTEALARGLPVVTTDLPSTRDATQGGRFGRLLPLNDDEALASALAGILQGRSAAGVGADARRWIEARFSHDAHWAQLAAIYAHALN